MDGLLSHDENQLTMGLRYGLYKLLIVSLLLQWEQMTSEEIRHSKLCAVILPVSWSLVFEKLLIEASSILKYHYTVVLLCGVQREVSCAHG